MTRAEILEKWKSAPKVADEILANCKANNLVIPHPQAPDNEDAMEYKVLQPWQAHYPFR